MPIFSILPGLGHKQIYTQNDDSLMTGQTSQPLAPEHFSQPKTIFDLGWLQFGPGLGESMHT